MRLGLNAVVGVVVLAGCQEKLTAPADCPALCPGGQPQVFDEVLSAIPRADSSFSGYVRSHQAQALLVSNGLQGFEERGLVRFNRRNDSVSVRDTLRGYTIDSVALSFTILARDTTLGGLQLLLYRLSPTFDSTTTFAGIAPGFAPESLIGTINLPDSLKSGSVRTVFPGPDPLQVRIPASDSGRFAVGVRVSAPNPTGVRLAAFASGSGAQFATYVTLDVPDTGTAKLRTLSTGPAFNSFVTEAAQTSDSTFLAIGGEPSSRALLRFSLPARIRDSATILRATLELTPVAPISGLPSDPVRLQARPVLADVGAKSPVGSAAGLQAQFPVPADTLENGTSGTIGFEAVRLVELWLGRTARPSALVVALAPELEAASFSRPVFYSTRAVDPAVRPRLRVSYLLSFPFESP